MDFSPPLNLLAPSVEAVAAHSCDKFLSWLTPPFTSQVAFDRKGFVYNMMVSYVCLSIICCIARAEDTMMNCESQGARWCILFREKKISFGFCSCCVVR